MLLILSKSKYWLGLKNIIGCNTILNNNTTFNLIFVRGRCVLDFSLRSLDNFFLPQIAESVLDNKIALKSSYTKSFSGTKNGLKFN